MVAQSGTTLYTVGERDERLHGSGATRHRERSQDVTAFDPQIGGTPVPRSTGPAARSELRADGMGAVCSISYPYQLRWIQGLMGWTGAQAAFTMNTSVTFRNE